MKRLNFLLEKSGAYATILGSKLAKQQEQARERAAQIDNANTTASAASTTTQEDQTAQSPVEEVPSPTTPAKRGRKPRNATGAIKRKQTDTNYQLSDYLKEDVSYTRNDAKQTRLLSIVNSNNFLSLLIGCQET